VRGNVHEPDFAEPELAHHPVAAVDGQTHVLGGHAAEVDGRIGRVGRLGRRPRELEVAQRGPVGSILGILDGHALEPEAEDQLELHVVVPHEHLVEFVDAIELILNVQRLGAGQSQPHIAGVDRVLIVGVEAGTVDRPLRPGPFVRHAVGRREDARYRIHKRLGGETPDLTLVDRVVRRGIDFIDAPVIRGFEIQHAGRIERGSRLPLADQHVQRIAPVGGIDVVK